MPSLLRLCVALAALLRAAAQPPPAASQAAAEAALHQIARDPLGGEDSFARLPAPLRRVWAASAASESLRSLLDHFSRPLEVNVALDVRLVGFDGDGCARRPLPSLLTRPPSSAPAASASPSTTSPPSWTRCG